MGFGGGHHSNQVGDRSKPDMGPRIGVFGCLLGCASWTEGDSQTQASVSPTIGGGIMICEKTPKQPESCPAETPPQNCGMYDPNCDNSVTWGMSTSPKGAGIGVSTNSDGTFCIVLGPFMAWPLAGPNWNLGGLSE
jgi:hypothetical protein